MNFSFFSLLVPIFSPYFLFSCFCTKAYSVQFINMKYHRRWKIQMAAWRLWICNRSLQLLKPPMFCLFCAGSQLLTGQPVILQGDTTPDDQGDVLVGKGRQKWTQKVFLKGHSFSPNELGLRPTKLCHAMLPAVSLPPPCKSIFIGSFKLKRLLCYLGLQGQSWQSAWSFLVLLCQRDSTILFYNSLTYCPFFEEKLNQYSPSTPSTWQMQSELFT